MSIKRAPSVEDQKSETGEFVQGVRAETASYLFTKSGDFILPEVKITWWDLATQKLVDSRLPAVTVHVAESDAYISELPPERYKSAVPTSTFDWKRYIHIACWSLLSLVIAALLMWIAYLWGPRLISWEKAAANRQRESEPAYWRRFKRSCDENNASQIYARLLSWLQRSRPGVTPGEFHQIAGDPRLDQQIDALSRVLFRPSESARFEGRCFYAAVAPHRRGNETVERVVPRLRALNP